MSTFQITLSNAQSKKLYGAFGTALIEKIFSPGYGYEVDEVMRAHCHNVLNEQLALVGKKTSVKKAKKPSAKDNSHSKTELKKQKLNLQRIEKYITTFYPEMTGSHFITLVDILYMAAVRNKVEIETLLDNLYKGIIDLDFYKTKNGNIYDFIEPKWRQIAQRIKDITVGSNGGMASVGKGEWLLSLGSGINPETKTPRVITLKDGHGDVRYTDSEENIEMKWNGGKVSCDKPGNEINRLFNSMTSKDDRISFDDKTWVPFRKQDKGKYLEREIQILNAVYWECMSGEKNKTLSDNELMAKIIHMSFKREFEKSDKFIMFNDDGKFQRFDNVDEADDYYKDKYPWLKGSKKGFECRAKQSNPIALYCYVF